MKQVANRHWRDIDIRYYAIAASLLLSLSNALLNQVTNVDGFVYVRTAEVFLNEGLAAAFAWYPSATYPIAIAVLHQLTGLDLFAAGQLVNALLYALLVYAFISLSLEMRDTRRLALLAAVTVLVFPQLNEYRYYLIRDSGFLAFTITGLLHLTRFSKTRKLRNALSFCLLTLVAALFRVEALVFLCTGPLLLLWQPEWSWRDRVRAVLKVMAMIAGLMTAGLLLVGAAGVDVPGALRGLLSGYLPFLQQIFASLGSENSPLGEAVFGEYAADYSNEFLWLFMLSGLTALLAVKIVQGLGVPALLIVLYGLRNKAESWHIGALRPTLGYALISFLILLTFMYVMRFMTTRYTLLFCTLIVLLVPLVIDTALQNCSAANAKKMKGALAFLLLFCAIDAHVSFGDSKTSLQQASDWLRQNTEAGAVVMTNSTFVAYHSQRVRDYEKVPRYIDQEFIGNAPYDALLALSLERNVEELVRHSLEFQQIELMASFPSEDDPELVIYRRLGN